MTRKKIRIEMNGSADPDPCTLRKSQHETVEWFADDTQHHIHIVFDNGVSPIKNKNRIIKNGGGGDEHIDSIDEENTPAGEYSYHREVKAAAASVAADPQIIILD